MALENCTKCGKAFFNAGGRSICPECRKAEDDQYERVREYVKENPKAPIEIVSEETGVCTEKIREYLHDGLLELSDLKDDRECQLCGKPISSGNYCFSCLNRLKDGLKSGDSHRNKAKDTSDKKQKESFMKQYYDKRNK